MTETSAYWNMVLAPGSSLVAARIKVGDRIKEILDPTGFGGFYTTTELVERIYPAQMARGEGITARKRLYTVVLSLTEKELAAYCTQGEPVPHAYIKGKMVRHWTWHAPCPVEGSADYWKARALGAEAALHLAQTTIEGGIQWKGEHSDD